MRLLCAVVCAACMAFPALAGEIEIEGKRYTFSQIVSETTTEGNYLKNPYVGKTAKLWFLPGWSWEKNKDFQVFWSLEGTELRINFSDAIVDPFYGFRIELVSAEKTSHGIVSFEMAADDFHPLNNTSTPILKTIIQYIEDQRKSDTLSALEVTGKIGILDAGSFARDIPPYVFTFADNLEEARVVFVFIPDPGSTRIVDTLDVSDVVILK